MEMRSPSSVVLREALRFPMRGDDEAIQILTADELAEFLGVNRKTIYEAASRNEIPHCRLGRRLIFERGSVLRWLRQAVPSEEIPTDEH
ncbi:helix-turn-helix domain-containing protein [Enhygromyxa salina]|uniref:Helix-turn-helix domain protein n=1 Tax=Enhygromyxa salina TaxID=215803 RepID=A0A2S9YJ40_9BACT|nr:helix-turn-helix domain-containing protein [Enhygromyxa salina]PRQ05119.1 Helix-turn-helix domain protein [Enhygromyxa salina]